MPYMCIAMHVNCVSVKLEKIDKNHKCVEKIDTKLHEDRCSLLMEND